MFMNDKYGLVIYKYINIYILLIIAVHGHIRFVDIHDDDNQTMRVHVAFLSTLLPSPKEVAKRKISCNTGI